MLTVVTMSSCEAPVTWGTQREPCTSCGARAKNVSFLVQRNRNKTSLYFLGLSQLRCDILRLRHQLERLRMRAQPVKNFFA
jgi:hypothetical protein